MKKKLNKAVVMITAIILLISCANYKNELFKGSANDEKVRSNIIVDFINTYRTPSNYLKKREGKSFDVFWINIHNPYRKRKLNIVVLG